MGEPGLFPKRAACGGYRAAVICRARGCRNPCIRPLVGICRLTQRSALPGSPFTEVSRANLGEAGFELFVSGLARGIDTACAQGGAGALRSPIPQPGDDRNLSRPEQGAPGALIAEGRACISEHARSGCGPRARQNFRAEPVHRLGPVAWVGGDRGGACAGSTDHARCSPWSGAARCFAVPAHRSDPRAEGTNDLIRQAPNLWREREHVRRNA